MGGTALSAMLVLGVGSSVIAAGETTNTVDSDGTVGFSSSLKLDDDGFPVISYYDATNFDLKVVHCNDAACGGGDEMIRTIDSDGEVGGVTSLELDDDGFPVISYYDATNQALKLAHCNDAACDGGDESIRAVDVAGGIELLTSLELDAEGFPVIAYTAGSLEMGVPMVVKVAHCNDAACDGGDETIRTIDSAGDNAYFARTSLALDADGFPVIGYTAGGHLKVTHCNDAACDGGDESIRIVSLDSSGSVSPVVLDDDGFPVISYYDNTLFDLWVVHCNDAACDGGDETIRTLDDVPPSDNPPMVLDAAGFPVIAAGLTLVHCSDAACGGRSVWAISAPGVGDTGLKMPSLQLDAAGFPVISFFSSWSDGDLMLTHCDDADCNPNNDSDGDGVLDADEAGPRATLPATGAWNTPATLPATGAANTDVSMWALLLVVAGAALVVTSRRRRTHN